MASKAVKAAGYHVTGGAKSMVRVLRVYDSGSTTVTVIDAEAYDTTETIWIDPIDRVNHLTGETITIPGRWTTRTYTTPAVTHQETVITGGRAIVFLKSGIPVREWKPPAGQAVPLEWPQTLTARQMSQGWTWAKTMGETSGKDRYGPYRQVAYVLTNPNKGGIRLEGGEVASEKKPLDLIGDFFDPLGLIH